MVERGRIRLRIVRALAWAVATQCVLAFIVWGMVWNGIGLGARWAATLQEDEFLPRLIGDLFVSVRNVFGDPVPQAHVHIGGRESFTENDGFVALREIAVGLHELRIQAEGYHEFSLHLRINEVENQPVIGFDQGLWPVGFAIDFHAFYAPSGQAEERIFFQIGMANGSEAPIYIREFQVFDEGGIPVSSLLDSPDAYRRIALMNTAFSLATQPYALILKPRGIAHIELQPLIITDPKSQRYRLVVWYGTEAEHIGGAYRTVEHIQLVAIEDDLNPHLP